MKIQVKIFFKKCFKTNTYSRVNLVALCYLQTNYAFYNARHIQYIERCKLLEASRRGWVSKSVHGTISNVIHRIWMHVQYSFTYLTTVIRFDSSSSSLGAKNMLIIGYDRFLTTVIESIIKNFIKYTILTKLTIVRVFHN